MPQENEDNNDVAIKVVPCQKKLHIADNYYEKEHKFGYIKVL